MDAVLGVTGIRFGLLFCWGAALGSFYHAWAWRLARGQSIVRGRSCCPVCGQVLSVRELIPLVSWLYQKGRCRHCGAAIPKRYPLVELLTAVLFVSLGMYYTGVQLLGVLLLCSLLLVIGLVDYDCWLIPDSLLVLGLLLYVPLQGLYGSVKISVLGSALLDGCVIAVSLWLFVLAVEAVLQRPAMGGGDIKLFFLLGVYLGMARTVLTLFIACLVGLVWQLGQQRLAYGGVFPFGPSIGIAVWLVLLWGQPMVEWYLGVLCGIL